MLMTTNLIGFMAKRRTAAADVNAIQFTPVGSSSSSSSTIVIPGNIQAGDIIVLTDKAAGTTGIPTTVVPTGFTSIINSSGGTARLISSYKIANGTESGTTITGMNGASSNRKALVVLRPDAPATSVTAFSTAGQVTDGNPTLQTVTAGSGTPALVVFGVYGTDSTAIAPRTFSPAPDAEITPATNHYLAYKIYNADPVNTSVDMDDEGLDNCLQSFYIQATVSGAAPQIAGFDDFPFTGSGSYSQTADFGAAVSDRLVAISVNGFNATSIDGIDSITIGGVAATLAVEEVFDIGGTAFFSSIYWAHVPTGSSGTIALTFTGDDLEAHVSVFKITGADTSAPVTTTANANVASGSVSDSVTPPANSVTIAGAVAGGSVVGSPNSNATWTNATEDYDLPSDPMGVGTDLNWTSAHRIDVSSPGSVSISVTSDDDTTPQKTLAIAVFS